MRTRGSGAGWAGEAARRGGGPGAAGRPRPASSSVFVGALAQLVLRLVSSLPFFFFFFPQFHLCLLKSPLIKVLGIGITGRYLLVSREMDLVGGD